MTRVQSATSRATLVAEVSAHTGYLLDICRTLSSGVFENRCHRQLNTPLPTSLTTLVRLSSSGGNLTPQVLSQPSVKHTPVIPTTMNQKRPEQGLAVWCRTASVTRCSTTIFNTSINSKCMRLSCLQEGAVPIGTAKSVTGGNGWGCFSGSRKICKAAPKC